MGHDALDEPKPECFGGVDHFARKAQQQGHAATDQARRSLRTAVARYQAEVDLGLPELRLVARDADIASQGDRHATAGGGTVDRRDDRSVQPFHEPRDRLAAAGLRSSRDAAR